MNKQTREKIDVAHILASVVGSRDIADRLKDVILESRAPAIDLDFVNVDFVSRSAAHQLLAIQQNMQKDFGSSCRE